LPLSTTLHPDKESNDQQDWKHQRDDLHQESGSWSIELHGHIFFFHQNQEFRRRIGWTSGRKGLATLHLAGDGCIHVVPSDALDVAVFDLLGELGIRDGLDLLRGQLQCTDNDKADYQHKYPNQPRRKVVGATSCTSGAARPRW